MSKLYTVGQLNQQTILEFLKTKLPDELATALAGAITDAYSDWYIHQATDVQEDTATQWFMRKINRLLLRYPKFAAAQTAYEAADVDGSLNENTTRTIEHTIDNTGNNTSANTPNTTQTNQTLFNALNGSSSRVSNSESVKLTGTNTTTNNYTDNKTDSATETFTRKFSDGRSWDTFVSDAFDSQSPLYRFLMAMQMFLLYPYDYYSELNNCYYPCTWGFMEW